MRNISQRAFSASTPQNTAHTSPNKGIEAVRQKAGAKSPAYRNQSATNQGIKSFQSKSRPCLKNAKPCTI
jgi:hypothetical protein